jgi:hypothetical protein
MSKLKVNQIEPASGDSVTFPAPTKVIFDGSLEGSGLVQAIATAISGYDDGEEGAGTPYYDFTFVSSPLISKAEDNTAFDSGSAGAGTADHVHSVGAHTHPTKISLYHSLLLRKKFVAGVMTEVLPGCGEFFQFANYTQGGLQGGFTGGTWFNVGNANSGMNFGITEAVANGNGWDEGTTAANTFKFGWFFTATTGGGSTARALARWIFDAGSSEWYYVTGAKPKGSAALNTGGGFWMWHDLLGWHWSRCDVFPFFYINTPMIGTTVPTGWSYWHVDDGARTRKLYLYGTQKWVEVDSAPLDPNSSTTNTVNPASTTPSTDVVSDATTIAVEAQS